MEHFNPGYFGSTEVRWQQICSFLTQRMEIDIKQAAIKGPSNKRIYIIVRKMERLIGICISFFFIVGLDFKKLNALLIENILANFC